MKAALLVLLTLFFVLFLIEYILPISFHVRGQGWPRTMLGWGIFGVLGVYWKLVNRSYQRSKEKIRYLKMLLFEVDHKKTLIDVLRDAEKMGPSEFNRILEVDKNVRERKK